VMPSRAEGPKAFLAFKGVDEVGAQRGVALCRGHAGAEVGDVDLKAHAVDREFYVRIDCGIA
jgi:hypothetical protein